MSAMNMNTPTYLLACTTSSVGITLSPNDINNNSVILFNAGSYPALIVSGATAPTAVAPVSGTPQNGTIVAAGAYLTQTKNTEHGFFAGIGIGGSTDVYIKIGTGE